MKKVLTKIHYDGSPESQNLILAMCEQRNINAYVSRRGIVMGDHDEHLVKKGDYFDYLLTLKN